jgi:hypothetical protein
MVEANWFFVDNLGGGVCGPALNPVVGGRRDRASRAVPLVWLDTFSFQAPDFMQVDTPSRDPRLSARHQRYLPNHW